MKKTISFTAGDGTIYDIPEEQVEAFKADFPDARQSQSFRVGETDYAIPDDMVSDFKKDFPDATPMRVFQMNDGSMRRVTPTSKIQRVSPSDFSNREAMGGMTKGALEVQAQGGPVAAEDDGSFMGWLKNAWNTFSHSASGKIVAGDVDWKRKQVMRGVAEKDGGKEVSFMDLPDSELDDYMNSIAPNGYWSYLGNAIGLNIKNDIMSEWDKTQGSKIADPAERKAARVKYAMDLARMTFEQNEQEKELARAELEGRDQQWQAGMTSGLVQMAGYAAPMMAPGVGIGLSATVEGTARRNELLADKYEADEDGNLYRVAEGDSRGSALVKGGIGGLATAVVEKFGGKIVGGALSKIPGVKKVAGKLADTKLGHAVNKWMRTYDKYMGWSGVHSAPEEFAEEFVQGTIDAALGLNETEDEKKGSTALGRAGEFAKDFFSPKNLRDLGESMLLMQIIGGGGAYFANRYSGAEADKILKRIDGIDTDKLKDFTAEDKWRAVSAYYNGMGEEQVAEVVNGGAKALDGLLKKFEGDAVKTADGRAGFAEAHPEAAKAIRDARRKGEDVSRKMLRDIGISEEVLSDKDARNAFGDDLLADSRRAAAIKRAKMDGQQTNALAQTVSEFVGDTPEAQRVFDRIVRKLKDASVLDDPYQRENLVMQAAEAVWNEDQAQRVGGARQKARMTEKADHEARLSEAEAQAEEAAISAENEAQERANAEALASEENRDNEFMLAKEEARAKGGQNEARTDETSAQSDEAQSVTPPAGETARPVEAGKAPTEEGGAVDGDPNADYPVGTIIERADGSRYIREEGNVTTVSGESAPKWREFGETGVARNGGKGRTAEQSHVFDGGGKIITYPTPTPTVEAPTSAAKVADANTPPTTTESAEGGYQASNAVSMLPKPKTVRQGKAFVVTNIGRRFTDGKKTYEITGLTKDGEVSVKVTDKIGKSSEATIKLSGALTRIFGTKKTSAEWSEVKTTDSAKKVPKTEIADKKTARIDEKAEVKKPTKPLKANPKKAAEVVKEFASKDESRPLINHIHHDHDRGLAVATDGRILIATKHGYDPNYKEDSQYPFPKWRKVVPSLKKGEGQTITIDPNAVLEATKAVKKLASGIKSDNMIRIKLPNGEHTYMNVSTLSRVAKAMAANGITDITTEGPFKPLLAKNNDTTIVAMPMRNGDGDVKLGRDPETSVVTFDLETGRVISAPESKISKMRKDFAEKLRTDIAEGRAKEIEWLRTTGLFKGLIAAQKKGETDAKKVYEGTTREDGSWDKLSEANKKFFTEMLATKDTAELENKFAEYSAKMKDSKKQSPLNDWVERTPKELAKLEKEIAAEDAIDAMMADAEPEPAPKSAKRVEGASHAPDAAAKKPFEERYREWAEEDVPAWAKALSPEDKAEYERLLDDAMTDKGETDSERGKHAAQALAAIEAFEKAHTPKRGRGRPKKVAAETKAPEAKVEPQKTEAAAEPDAAKPDAPKGAKIDMKPVIAAMHKLGDLAMSDVVTLEKALREAEARGQADRADNIRTFLDYKKSVGVNADPKSDKTQGGRYRASIESEKPLDDPKFRAWAKRRGAAPTQQKREEYDAAMVKQATKRLSRWIKGVSVKTGNFIAPDEDGDVRHSIKQEEYDAWNKVLDDYEQGKILPGDQKTILPRTPSVLLKIGASNRPIAIHGGIIDKIVGKVLTKSGDRHEVPISELRNLQIELDNPIAVFRSKTDSNSLVVLTRIVDKNNNEKAVVALKLDAKVGRNHIVNSIASIHGRPTYQVNNWIGEGHLLYVNKEARKNTARWLQLPGDKVLRASGVLTEKDFSDEELGRIVPKSDADSNDAAYLDAVKRDDMETAQRMVREAAAKAMPDTKVLDEDGLPLMVYHGTYQHGFTVFKAKDEGVYTSSSKENAEGYSFGANSGVYDLFVNAKNPLIVDAEGSKWSGMKFKGIEKFKKALNTRVISPADLAVYAREHGYDGVIIKNVFDGDVMGDDVIVYQSSQIKSADLVTYDDAGNVIPLSQRFNPENHDIRYLRDGKRIVGSYNLKTGEVTLAKGASVETVAHELGWHAAFDWAKRNAATNERAKALYERMRSFADEAPDAVKAEIAALYGKLDADAFADEVGAALFVRGQAEQFAGAIDPMVDAPWYKKAWRTVVDIVKDWLSSRGMNRVDLDGVEEMSERRFSEFLATAMLSGKTLGERKGFSMDLDTSKSKKWERKLSDRYEPIKELMERVEGNNGEAYRMARTLEGMAQMGKNRAERAKKRVDKILVANDISPELLAQYMQAMAYEERNAKIEKRNRKKDGSGMTQDSAEQTFAEIDERGVREKCQEAADILWKIQDEGLQARVDAGLIDQETADKWRKEEPHHVPWRDAIDPDTGEWMGRNYMGPEFDTAEGRSTSATGDPITLMLQEYENAYARAAENALRQNLADIARLNTDVGTIFDSIQVDAKGHRSFIKFPAKGSGEKAKMLAIPDGSKIESTKAGDGGMANILTYRENGETKYLALNGSLGEAIAAAVTGRSLLRPPVWLSKFMRGYAATATALSPTFAIRNTMADHFDIHGNMVKDFGLLKGEKMYAKMVAEEVKMSKELLQYVHTGDFAHDANGKATTAFGKLIEEYEAAGGLIGGLRTEGYDVIQKRIRADFRSGRNKLRSVGREIAAGWTDLQKMSELSTRLAAFKVMKESGMSAKEAAMWSRESTVDFNKKGNWTPISNILWMFSNSALGSGVRQAKGLLTTKNGLQLATGLAAWGFIEGMLECAMNEGYDDEEEKRGSGTGADLNEYTRQNSAYLRFGDTVYRTNLHMGPYGIIKYAGNVAARVMSGRLTAEKAAKELGLTAAEVAAAFTGMGNVSADAILETGMPTALQPFVQGITGKDYAGRPLYRKKYDEAKPDSSHGRKSTAAGYQWLAKKVNEITGGDEYSKGGIDIAPETVKLITETAGKNFVRDIVNIVQTSARLMSGDNEPRNIPFVRDAVRKVDGNENRYYEALRRYDADKLKLKDPNLKGEERRAFLNAHPWLKSNGKKGSTVVSTLETRIKDLMKKEENPNLSDERKEELKTLRRRLQARVIERMTEK